MPPVAGRILQLPIREVYGYRRKTEEFVVREFWILVCKGLPLPGSIDETTISIVARLMPCRAGLTLTRVTVAEQAQ